MTRRYTITEMKKANKQAGHYFWHEPRKYRESYGIIKEKVFYDGMNNYVCVYYRTGKKSWWLYNPTNGHLIKLKTEAVPGSVRSRA